MRGSPEDKRANTLFLKYKRQIENSIGKQSTALGQLDEIGHFLFANKWAGVYTADESPNFTGGRKYAIFNLDKKGEPGSHWVAVVKKSAKSIIIWDSFGRQAQEILPELTNKYSIIEPDRDTDQRIDENDCGQNSLSFLMLYDRQGWRYARHI